MTDNYSWVIKTNINSELTIQILNNFDDYNIRAKYLKIPLKFDISDDYGIGDIFMPSALILIKIVMIKHWIMMETKSKISENR